MSEQWGDPLIEAGVSDVDNGLFGDVTLGWLDAEQLTGALEEAESFLLNPTLPSCAEAYRRVREVRQFLHTAIRAAQSGAAVAIGAGMGQRQESTGA